MTMRRIIRSITTDASGDATDLTPITAGRVHAVYYRKNALTPYAAGVDFNITNATTGETIWQESNVNASAVRYPRVPTHTSTGVAATFDGTRPVLDYPALARDQIQIVVSSGGDTKDGIFVFAIDG